MKCGVDILWRSYFPGNPYSDKYSISNGYHVSEPEKPFLSAALEEKLDNPEELDGRLWPKYLIHDCLSTVCLSWFPSDTLCLPSSFQTKAV